MGTITNQPSDSENYGFDTNLVRFRNFIFHPILNPPSTLPIPMGAEPGLKRYRRCHY